MMEMSGRQSKTDNNRMELQAAIEGLNQLPPGSDVTLYSDSRVLIDAVTMKFPGWKNNGWVKQSGKQIPNLDLFIVLEGLVGSHQIKWQWVKAHSGVQYNERCDHLCTQARVHGVIAV